MWAGIGIMWHKAMLGSAVVCPSLLSSCPRTGWGRWRRRVRQRD